MVQLGQGLLLCFAFSVDNEISKYVKEYDLFFWQLWSGRDSTTVKSTNVWQQSQIFWFSIFIKYFYYSSTSAQKDVVLLNGTLLSYRFTVT